MRTKLSVVFAAALLALVALPAPAAAQTLNGLWDATVVVNNGIEIPFRIELSGSGAAAKGSFFNGDEKVTSTTGTFENGALTLSFDEYGTKLEATLKDGRLEGQYTRGTRGAPYPFQAKKFAPVPVGDAKIPQIAGLWNVQVKSSKGESAWQLIVRQAGAEASASILRIDGDTGALTGTYHDGKFVLSHFSGARPLRLELTPGADGTLSVVQNQDNPLVATRMEIAKAKGLPEPSDPSRFTSVKDPTEPFRFSFPDITGKLISNTDPQFRGKVVIVSIAGSWCPNCHDEAPFFTELYRKYHGKGLEIVALSFEEAAQLQDPARLKAYVTRYGITYPMLLAGIPDQLTEKVPQIENLNSFPTTIFLGRDGLVREVHAGFPSKASGRFYTETRDSIRDLVEQLLSEN